MIIITIVKIVTDYKIKSESDLIMGMTIIQYYKGKQLQLCPNADPKSKVIAKSISGLENLKRL